MRAWGIGISLGHLCLGLAGWLAVGVPPWFFGGCAVVTLAGALLSAPLLRPRPDDEDGGGGPDSPGPGDPGPPWWPEFEREFRDYANRHLTAR
jgi:hypothetical protein